MNSFKCNFKRMEIKYLLPPKQYAVMMRSIEPYMSGDEYGFSKICNLYCDTDDYRLVRASLEKPIYKEKLRLRSYGTPRDSDTVFLEIKKKFESTVYKRRVPMTLTEARSYLSDGIPPNMGAYSKDEIQIFSEIDWMMNLYKPEPKVFLVYDRTAYFAKDDPEFRMTFDTNVRWRQENLDLGAGDYGTALLGGGQYLMEVKASDAYPLWLCDILDKNRIYPVSYSKYGTCYTAEIFNNTNNTGGMHCA